MSSVVMLFNSVSVKYTKYLPGDFRELMYISRGHTMHQCLPLVLVCTSIERRCNELYLVYNIYIVTHSVGFRVFTGLKIMNSISTPTSNELQMFIDCKGEGKCRLVAVASP